MLAAAAAASEQVQVQVQLEADNGTYAQSIRDPMKPSRKSYDDSVLINKHTVNPIKTFRHSSCRDRARYRDHHHHRIIHMDNNNNTDDAMTPPPASPICGASATPITSSATISATSRPPCLSSSSSSASDSAFSRSQTTLGSEKEDSASAIDRLSSDGGEDKDDDDDIDDDDDDDDKHFKIVWQKLSYRVPDKRLARLSCFVAKLKQKWLPSDSEQQTTVDDSHLDTIRHRLEATAAPASPPTQQHKNQHQHTITTALGPKLVSGCATVGLPLKSPNGGTKQRKIIFSDLNGCVKSGQLTAILGPSGAGKTTFLKCLTNSIVSGVSGQINIHGSNGSAATSQHLKLCIIPQKVANYSTSLLTIQSLPPSTQLPYQIIDYLFDNLTVMENLLFASRIKNTQPNNFDHKENVYRIANLLGLQTCLKLKTSRLSGGQYKRVSIAQELLSQPDILILDEPTSGLDSLTCYRTVSVLRELADMSQTGLLPPLAIIMTIHQPQIKIFNLFHHVYILSSLGQCVYEGRPEFLIDTVADRCKLLPPPDDQNPASFIIDLASEVYGYEPIKQLIELQRENFLLMHNRKRLLVVHRGGGGGDNNNHDNNNNEIIHPGGGHSGKLAAAAGYEDKLSSVSLDCSKLAGNLKNKQQLSSMVSLSMDMSDGDGDGDCSGGLYISEQLKKRNNHQHSFWLHTGLLINRLWISTWRDSLLTSTRVTFHLMIPFVFYFVYSQKSGSANACPYVERELDIQEMISDSNIKRLAIQHDELILTFENVSLFFLLLYSFSMCVLAVTALSFPLNMQILLKETSNGWYTMPRFVMAKTLADLPIELTMPMISVSIAYALTGQPSSYLCWRMLSVTAVMTLCSLISQTQGLLFGAYFMNNVQAAVFVSQASTLPWIMLSGFTTRISQLPRLLQWLSYGSIYRLGIESIVAVRYGFGMCPCDEDSINDTPPRIIGIPDQVRSVMSYYMDVYSTTPQTMTTTISPSSLPSNSIPLIEAVTTNSSSSSQSDIFGKIASTLARANTYGADVVTCNDVRPFIMSAREVNETTLPIFLSILLAVLIGLKILLFYVVRIRAG